MRSILVTKKTKMSHRQLKVSQLQKGRSPKQHSYPSQCIRNTVSEECALSKKRSRLWPWQKRSSLGFSNLIGRTTGQRTENWSSVSCEGVKYRLLPPSDAQSVRMWSADFLAFEKSFFFLLGNWGHLKTWLIGESDYDSTHTPRAAAAKQAASMPPLSTLAYCCFCILCMYHAPYPPYKVLFSAGEAQVNSFAHIHFNLSSPKIPILLFWNILILLMI